MPKIKPILIFIIASIALHWWILSLPMFKRIQVLEGGQVKSASPTVMAYLKKTEPQIQPPEKTEAPSQSRGDSNLENLQKLTQQPPPPSFLRGSPWMRRPSELRADNPGVATSTPLLTQVTLALQNEDIEQAAELECKRVGVERLFKCQGSSNVVLTLKIEKVLNQASGSSIASALNCISLQELEKKWHAKACHS